MLKLERLTNQPQFGRTCYFCNKQVFLPENFYTLYQIASNRQNFFCSFCLQHHYHIRHKDILITSFRAVLGYYYYRYYLGHPRVMYLSQLRDYEKTHRHTGLQNPLFAYDPHTLLWFVDFSESKRIGVVAILQTIHDILSTLKLPPKINDRFYRKYHSAIMRYHEERYRPTHSRMLIPTLINCIKSKYNLVETKFFHWNGLDTD